MTTHVNPADGGDSLEYYKKYCMTLGMLEQLCEVAANGDAFHGNQANRMAAFYHGVLGLFDQAWKVETLDLTPMDLPEASLLGRMLAYGRECFRQAARLADERASSYMEPVDTAEELLYLLNKAQEVASQLNADKGSEPFADRAPYELSVLVEQAQVHLQVTRELAEAEGE